MDLLNRRQFIAIATVSCGAAFAQDVINTGPVMIIKAASGSAESFDYVVGGEPICQLLSNISTKGFDITVGGELAPLLYG